MTPDIKYRLIEKLQLLKSKMGNELYDITKADKNGHLYSWNHKDITILIDWIETVGGRQDWNFFLRSCNVIWKKVKHNEPKYDY